MAPASLFAYDLSLPAGFSLVANQLNAVGGNCISNVFPPIYGSLPDGTFVTIYKKASCAAPQTYYYCYHCDIGGEYIWWLADTVTPFDPTGVNLDPGDALFLDLSYAATVSFTGTPNVPVLPLSLSCGCGHYYFLSRQTNDVGTFENITGLPPQEGSQFQRWTGSNFNVFTFSAGAWTPSVPSANRGEAVRILLSPCFSNSCLTLQVPSNIVVTSWTNIPVSYTPMASDICTNAPNVICTPRSGTVFQPGTTTAVHCLAIDNAGNGAVGDFTVTVVRPKLEIASAGEGITLSWAWGGTLQEADTPNGSWADVPGKPVSPFTVSQTVPPGKFYRLHFE